MNTALTVVRSIFSISSYNLVEAGILPSNGIYLLGGILFYLGLDRYVTKDFRILSMSALHRWCFYYLLFFIVFFAGVRDSAKFIYFQF